MDELRKTFARIDGKGYKAYKDIRGFYRFPDYKLAIDYVQGDPFASPSKIRIIIDRKRTKVHSASLQTKKRKIATEDEITRTVARALREEAPGSMGTGKSGLIAIDRPGQEVLERTAVTMNEEQITLCLSVGLPARGRKVLGKQAEALFYRYLPQILKRSVFSLDAGKLEKVQQLADNQEAIRTYLRKHGYVAFVADGSILPRESGISDRPLKRGNVIPFRTPDDLAVEIEVPHGQPIRGMGIRKGITLIVGGGYHGKSTLLQAIERGVYDHIEGDGREYVLTDPTAFKIRAEDGRQVTKVDISPFINNLPFGKDTKTFTSENASGSTSQAANIIEALESGAKTLLIDEDTSATNFMIRDSRMQALVASEKEPITPFLDKVKQLYRDYGVSTILVMGGSGDYFDVADCVIMMEQYLPYHVTEKAREIAESYNLRRKEEGGETFGRVNERRPAPGSLNPRKGKKEKVTARGLKTIQFGATMIELDQVEQLVDESQTRAIGEILHDMERKNLLQKNWTFRQLLDEVEMRLEKDGLASFTLRPNEHPGELARPRRLEIAAALNRLRTLKIKA